MQQAKLVLRRNEERRLQAGHLWVFSNEVDTGQTPLGEFEAGMAVAIHSSRDKYLGMATVNPHSLICARIYSYKRGSALDADLLRLRISTALQSRDALYEKPCYRLINAEGDWLPGLVVDRFGDALAVQISTAAMEARLEDILSVLVDLLSPRAIMLRNGSAIRELEQLPLYERLAHGESVSHIEIEENNLRYQIPFIDGQKTGWYFDHRDNRALLARMVSGKRVLDACCYLGAWGINALAGGAHSVTAIDSSQVALDGAASNATLNGYADQWQPLKGELVAQMRKLHESGERFDVVVLDPPAFIKRKKDRRSGIQKYQSANNLALKLLTPGGLLVSCSCSHHLAMAELQRLVQESARKTGGQSSGKLQVIARRGQGLDHPLHPAIAETDYLKALFARQLPDQPGI